jgi:hypothetical protein
MNASFRSMSDLLADSEDLLAKIGRSQIPQVRALQKPFLSAVNQMKEQLRERAKKQQIRQDVTRRWTENRCMRAAAAAFLAVSVLAWLRNRSR